MSGRGVRRQREAVDDLSAQFQCPVCTDFLYEKIFQCRNGHVVCESCLGKLGAYQRCPTCRVKVSSGNHGIRNLQMEQLRNLVKLPCPFERHGCQRRLLGSEIQSHKLLCSKRPFRCACAPMCSEIFPKESMWAHIRNKHATVGPYDLSNGLTRTTTLTNRPGFKSPAWHILISHSNLQFLGSVRIRKKKVHAFVRCLTAKSHEFVYSIGLASLQMNDNTRAILWSAPVRDIETTIDEMISSGDCLTIPLSMAKFFSGRNDVAMKDLKLKLSVSLKRCQS